LIEARTDAFTSSSWDYGPDPFLGFNRSDVLARVGLRRGFFARRLVATLAVQQDVFIVPDRTTNLTSDGSETPAPYEYAFLEQDVRVDLRDSRLRPTLGAYFGLNATESPRSATSDWTMFRLAPEARGYLPLPLDAVFAARFAIGAIFIQNSDASLDAISRQLGPTSYRLRGGGANSNRGFLPGQLGAGIQGGLRRWESSAELRFAFGQSLGLVGFMDFGDVNDSPVYRFGDLNTSAGFGLRYHTVIGVLRLDAGFRIPAWQRVDGSDGIEANAHTLPWSSTPGAVHFTIGESF
jgi:outer membrane protein assembly factor BamA